MITDRPSEQDSVIEFDGAPVVIVRWPGGNAGLGRTYARDVASAIDAQRAAVRASPTTLTHAEQLAEAAAAIARLTRERDDEHCDFEAANYDCARLINAIRGAVDLDDVRGLAEECASNGRSGWIPQALQIDTRTEGRWLKLVDERDCARRENEILLRERDEARALASEMSAAYTLMSETVVGQGKQLDEARAAAAAERVEANEAIAALHDARAEIAKRCPPGCLTHPSGWYETRCNELKAEIARVTSQRDDTIATALRLREHVAFYELGHYRAKALEDALSSDEAAAVRGVLAACEHVYNGRAPGQSGARAATDAWVRAGRPLLAGVPSPASEEPGDAR
jgi:hypothetical protein